MRMSRRPRSQIPDAASLRADFIAEAESFAQRHGAHPAFRILRSTLRCRKDELAQLAKFIYCACLPSNTISITENHLRTAFGLSALPLYYLASKSWRWTPEQRVDYILETIDPPYFNAWFATIYERLRGSKRLSARIRGSFSRPDAIPPFLDSVVAADLLRLLLLMPLLLPSLLDLCARTGLALFKPFRQAIAVYLTYRGFFHRYPCRNYVTFDDMPNHPARYIAFRQSCPGTLTVIQNGERSLLPQLAFGMVDHYLLFGRQHIEIMSSLRTHARRLEPVGALCLNARHALFLETNAGGPPPIHHDILFIDQGISRFNGTPAYFGEALERILANLHRYKKDHPGCRIAYQLRFYAPEDRPHRTAVLDMVNRNFPGTFLILGNESRGESYRNILHADLAVTFESTLGFEALRMGRKVLFVNYSGNPGETVCDDRRFQISDPTADYARFAQKVEELRNTRLEDIPEVALHRHHSFDGQVQERVADFINARTGKEPSDVPVTAP